MVTNTQNNVCRLTNLRKMTNIAIYTIYKSICNNFLSCSGKSNAL